MQPSKVKLGESLAVVGNMSEGLGKRGRDGRREGRTD